MKRKRSPATVEAWSYNALRGRVIAAGKTMSDVAESALSNADAKALASRIEIDLGRLAELMKRRSK